MSDATHELMKALEALLKEYPIPIHMPPPVFTLMEGEVVAFDAQRGFLSIEFPVKDSFLNPYGAMQGGMIATAIDNTIGPIALLNRKPNVTQHLELEYKTMIRKESRTFFVDAWYVKSEGRDLYFEATVHDGNGLVYTTAFAHHKILRLSK